MREELINKQYIYLLDILGVDYETVKNCVETGTYEGRGAYTFASRFDTVRTVELSEDLYKLCCKEYKDEIKIRFYHGSSTDKLEEMVKDIKDPYFLFLDSHGSGGNTVYDDAYGPLGSPVLEELDCVKDNPPEWIVIDDLRDFDNPQFNYPRRNEIVKKVSEVGEYENPQAIKVGDREHPLYGIPQWFCFKKK